MEKKATQFGVPHFSWSVLASVPKLRILAIARRLGCYEKIWRELPPGRIAEELLGRKMEILSILTVDELCAIAKQLGIATDSRRKADIISRLLKPRRNKSTLSRYDNLPEQIDDKENSDLRAWVAYYLRRAESWGYTLDFTDDYQDEYQTATSYEGTIRLICEQLDDLVVLHLVREMFDGLLVVFRVRVREQLDHQPSALAGNLGPEHDRFQEVRFG